MITRQYRLINNIGGWFVFLIALITYWLTLEPTASYWDCGEFIIQADKLEVGHPPGNPIFMLTARFFSNFAPSPEKISVMVNAMSGLLSALTILLLFWTITHLVRRLIIRDNKRGELSLQKYIVIMGSGLVGSLAYCWSDTFWFSAVEGEVYAFSSFCTALVFWLILKWENRVNEPHSDRYLILIAYIIGVSIAVHLLNLLCIPAIVLVFAYRKWPEIRLIGSLVALMVSFGIIVLVLYGLVPGFIKVAQLSELLFVNGFHLSFNSGALAYVIVMVVVLLWAIYEIRKQKNATLIRLSFLAVVTLSGMLFLGSGITVGIVLSVALIALLWFGFKRNLPVRALGVIIYSIGVIFIGYSSYALIIIRSSANTPMNQNAPDNVFDLASYLNREQYGKNPLLYGETLFSEVQYLTNGSPHVKDGKPIYVKGIGNAEMGLKEYGNVKVPSFGELARNRELAERGGDYYVVSDHDLEIVMNPELNMLLPRIYSGQHANSYLNWVDMDYQDPDRMEEIMLYDPDTHQSVSAVELGYEPLWGFKPSFKQNLAYFFNYQLNHMYMRYFLWNFVGRQNDILNQRGELDAGNWISGIPAIDNSRLGDQSLLPDEMGKGNPGHNVYYFLPLILGIIGLIWQSSVGKRGVEQFWIVFFLFFMTGIAIVLYLNQTPDQPRERDYAFAGSFYAFTIWIGMGVAGLWRFLMMLANRGKGTSSSAESKKSSSASAGKLSPWYAVVAVVLGICVPLQMVSQTWDDHDRSDRFAARDYAINYLESLEPNAIIFCNGDNDTFPLWYVQEVEGVRPDVKIINLSYLNSEWYANQHRIPSYTSEAVKFTATPEDIAYGKLNVVGIPNNTEPADLMQALKKLYADARNNPGQSLTLASRYLTIPIDKQLMVKRGLVSGADTARMNDQIIIDVAMRPGGNEANRRTRLMLGELLMLDLIATNAADGWQRPIYWASTVGDDYHVGLTDYLRSTGMAYQLVPTMQADKATRTDRAYDVITKKYKWGIGKNGEAIPYFDETARRMLYGMRMSILDLSSMLYTDGCNFEDEGKVAEARQAFEKALEAAKLMESKLPERISPFDLSTGMTLGELYCEIGSKLGDKQVTQKGLEILRNLLQKYSRTLRYYSEVTNKFLNPKLTYENQLIPIYYYRLAEMYIEKSGDGRQAMEYIDKQLKGTGFSLETLAQINDQYYNGGNKTQEVVNPAEELDYIAEEIAKYCEVANTLSAMSPQEYENTSADERELDSLVEYAIEFYVASGGTEKDLEKFEHFRNLDRNRSKRLYEEYKAANP